MIRGEILGELNSKFKNDIIDVYNKTEKRVYIEIKPDAIVKVAQYMFRNLGARFNIASGVDTRECIEILYHFTIEEINLVISLRVKLDKARPEIDSLAPHIKATDWIEREIHEILGVNFKGHPDMRKLLLSDDWPEGVYPLRKDYEEWDDKAIRDRGV